MTKFLPSRPKPRTPGRRRASWRVRRALTRKVSGSYTPATRNGWGTYRGRRREGEGASRTITWPVLPSGEKEKARGGDHLAGSSDIVGLAMEGGT